MCSNNNFQKILVLVLFVGFQLNFCLAQDYNSWFTKDVLRIDFAHSGDAKSEYYFAEQFYKKKAWAGTYSKLIDKTGYGDNFFEVYDSTSQKLIYSRGYNNLFYEWQETAEAKLTNRSFEEVIRFPFPKNTVNVKLYKRLKNGELNLLHELFVNPTSYRINKGEKFDFKTDKIHGKLPSNKAVDVVLLAEGYTKEEMGIFLKDAHELTEFLFETEPFNQVKEQFNIWIVMSESEESGTDISGQDIWKNTILNSHFYTFNSERYLTSQSIKTIHDVAALVPYDQVYVLVNSDKYGGGGIFNYYNLSSTHNKMSPWVFIHEFGHGFAGLADEYYDASTLLSDMYDLETEPWRPNITTMVDIDSKWKSKLDKDTPIPTPATEEKKNKIGQDPVSQVMRLSHVVKKVYSETKL